VRGVTERCDVVGANGADRVVGSHEVVGEMGMLRQQPDAPVHTPPSLGQQLGQIFNAEFLLLYAQDGSILAVPVRMANRMECSDRKIVSQCRERAKWVYTGCRFRGQKGNSG
jgi:hypothetical protein